MWYQDEEKKIKKDIQGPLLLKQTNFNPRMAK